MAGLSSPINSSLYEIQSSLGCNRLSAISENTVIAFTEVGGDDNNRLTVTLNQAYRVRLSIASVTRNPLTLVAASKTRRV